MDFDDDNNDDTLPDAIFEELIDDDPDVRLGARFMMHYLDLLLDDEQIERGLTHPNPEVRADIASIADYWPTSSQVARALKDPSPLVRFAMVNRYDVRFTWEQIKAGIFDPDRRVADEFRDIFTNPKRRKARVKPRTHKDPDDFMLRNKPFPA